MSRMSVATIDNPEFINLQPLDINPLMSKCEIKVLYVGQNRNQSFITKEVATEMSKTLRGAPIVGWYKEDKEDFSDHGDRVIWDGDGIQFQCMTRPYGFVAPNAEVWFQKFEDEDDFGNKVVREYLMTTGFLWTGQYEEAKHAVENGGRPQSMELDKNTLDGKWSTDLKTGLEFFIINDAIFSKLCILGEDVEPCFEGAKISTPEVNKTFSKIDDDFKITLFTMMQDLKFALQGGQTMAEKTGVAGVDTQVTTPAKDFSAVQDKDEQNVSNENQNFTESSSTENAAVDTGVGTSEYKKEEDEEDKASDEKEDEVKDDDEEEKKKYKCGGDDDEEKKKYSLLEEKYTALKQKYAAMEKDYQALVEFKNNIDNEKKDALINSFYMLSDEDKKDVIENKAKYSLEEIESKLSVICFRKKVSFEATDENAEQVGASASDTVTTYSFNTVEDKVPAWVQACRNTQNKQQ